MKTNFAAVGGMVCGITGMVLGGVIFIAGFICGGIITKDSCDKLNAKKIERKRSREGRNDVVEFKYPKESE